MYPSRTRAVLSVRKTHGDDLVVDFASKRRWCFLTIRGSNEPARSCGWAIRMLPCPVWSVFAVVPLRALPSPPGGARPRS
jgi:hypothetical protein